MNTFEKEKKVAFTVLLWIIPLLSILISIVSIVYHQVILIIPLFVLDCLIIFVVDTYWFNAKKVFKRTYSQWKYWDDRYSKSKDTELRIRKNPTLMVDEMEKHGYSNQDQYKRDLLEIILEAKSKSESLKNRLTEISTTQHQTLWDYTIKTQY